MAEAEPDDLNCQSQIEMSSDQLQKLLTDSCDFLTNVKLAADKREVIRRNYERENRRYQEELVLQQNEDMEEQCKEVEGRWNTALAKAAPQHIHDELIEQRAKCDAVLKQKNDLLQRLKGEIKRMDQEYEEELEKQKEDVDVLIQRMNDQFHTMKKAYIQQMKLIQVAREQQLMNLLKTNEGELDRMLENKESNENQLLTERMQKAEEIYLQLQQQYVYSTQEYRKTKEELDNNIYNLKQHLEKLKVTLLMNQEKLDYNYQVLKKRQQENLNYRSEIKRRVRKLQDNKTQLLKKLNDHSQLQKEEYTQLQRDVDRWKEKTNGMKEKTESSYKTTAKQADITKNMAEEELINLLGKICVADQAIFEDILGIPWESPDLTSLPKTRDQIQDDIMGMTAMEVASRLVTEGGDEPGTTMLEKILILMVEKLDFLMDSNVQQSLPSLGEPQQKLLKLDAIFKAVGIESVQDLQLLVEYFVQCGTDQEHLESAFPSDDETLHPNTVLEALKHFVQDQKQSKKLERRATLGVNLSEEVPDSELDPTSSSYWSRYVNVLSNDRELLWGAVETGLKKYHELLIQRDSLDEQVTDMERENTELRTVLHQYILQKEKQPNEEE